MKIQYTLHNGEKCSYSTTREQVIERLAYLDEQERIAQEFAPTDSGLTRINYCREADAIRNILA